MNALASHRGLLGASALVFVASAITTVLWCGSMASMPGMEMPGGWTMSMAWMRMPGQSGLGAAATFIGMWVVMMVAMMLPSLLPMLMRFRVAIDGAAGARLAWLTTIASVSYFAVWTGCGIVVYAVGLALAEIAMRLPVVSRSVPIASGVVVVIVGVLQLTEWKRRQLACCGVAPARAISPGVATAWRHGIRLGFHCLHCCAGLTSLLLVIGAMDLRAMAIVTALITAERVAPVGERVARATGTVIFAAGLYLIATG